VDGTAVAALGAAPGAAPGAGTCATCDDDTGAVPAGQRSLSGAAVCEPRGGCELAVGQRGPAVVCEFILCEFVVGEVAVGGRCSSGAGELVVGQRGVELYTGQRGVELSTGQRDVALLLSASALLLSDGGIAPLSRRSTSTIPPTSDLAFGRGSSLGGGTGARARASFAAALSGSNRGGSVCLLT